VDVEDEGEDEVEEEDVAVLRCPNFDVPLPGDACYSPVFNWGVCLGSRGGVDRLFWRTGGDAWCRNQGLPCFCFCDAYINLSLDVGNDSSLPWEWETVDPDFKRERVFTGSPLDVVLDKAQFILRHGCGAPWCVGCKLTGSDCLIPFVFHSGNYYLGGKVLPPVAGRIIVDDINFSFWMVETVENVSYDRRLRFSEGGNWTVSFDSGAGVESATYSVPPNADCKDLCFDLAYAAGNPPSGLDAYDAIDDSVYRLLYQRLDRDHDSIIEKLDVDHDGTPDTYFDPDRMWFDAQDNLGIQTLWGPEVFKLVVWAG